MRTAHPEAARTGGASEQERDAIEALIIGNLGEGGVHSVVAQMMHEEASGTGTKGKRRKGSRGAAVSLSAAAVAAAEASERAAADSGDSLAAIEAALSASLARQRALAAAAAQEEGAAALVHMLAKLHLLREKVRVHLCLFSLRLR